MYAGCACYGAEHLSVTVHTSRIRNVSSFLSLWVFKLVAGLA